MTPRTVSGEWKMGTGSEPPRARKPPRNAAGSVPVPFFHGFLFAALLTASLAGSSTAILRAETSWPTMHKDYQRSGHTDEIVNGPVERKWFRNFAEEMVGPRVEAIVADGLCFVGTYAGNLYALDVEDGKTVWTYHADGAIGHSACYDDGKVFFCRDDAYNAGSLVCLNAADGKEIWKYRAKAGIWNSPACDGRRVYVGDRGGTFHAVDVETGEKAWTFQTGYMILKPASFSSDKQKIVFGSEDMHVYCLSPQGELLWKSPKLPGLSLRDAAPTIWADKVVVRTNPARDFHGALREAGDLVCGIQREIPLDDNEDRVVVNTVNMYFVRHTPRREKAEYEGVLQYLREHPHSRTWFTLNLADGKEPWIVPVMYTGGLHNPPTPPTFDPQTMELLTIMPTALSVYCSGVSQVGIGIGRVDPATGYVANVAHAYPDREPGYFAGMPMIADETSALSLMGDFLTVTHMGAVGGADLHSREIHRIAGIRDTYGGIFGPGAHGSWEGSAKLAEQGYVQNTINEWHGPDRSVVSIAAGRMFWVVGGQVVCLGGPDVPATDSGGSKAPEPFRWKQMPRINGGNVTGALGNFDTDAPKKVLDAAALRQHLALPQPAKTLESDAASEIRGLLDRAVTELITGEPWAFFLVELGISHEEQHFRRGAEAVQTVAWALPYLSPEVRRQAVAWLDRVYDGGMKDSGGEGRRREYFDLSPELLDGPAARAPRDGPSIADLYAVWAYAHYAGRWDRVFPQAVTMREAFRDTFSQPFAFDPDRDDPGELNARIAGVIGYVRIAEKTGAAADAKMASYRLAEMVTQRVHCEIADPRLQGKRSHHGRLSRYENLTPELAAILSDHAGEQLGVNLRDLLRQWPVWYQAWGERLIGGENYVNPPSMSHGLFLILADGSQAPPEQLLKYLDHPWCRADLYYIDKLTALLRAMDRAE